MTNRISDEQEYILDCGDNSCYFHHRGSGGMRTNGGCRCKVAQVKRYYEHQLELRGKAWPSIHDKAAQSSQRSISAEVLNELLMLPERLLNKVNLVTAPYRHGNKILNSELDELCERQIEVEQALEKLREAIK